MAVASQFDAKTIDDLQELGKLTGLEKTIVSYDGEETRKVSIDTIVGYAAALINAAQPAVMSLRPNNSVYGGSLVFIAEGEDIPLNERTPGTFYLEESHQTSIRTKINIPTSVKVSSSLGLRRV